MQKIISDQAVAKEDPTEMTKAEMKWYEMNRKKKQELVKHAIYDHI